MKSTRSINLESSNISISSQTANKSGSFNIKSFYKHKTLNSNPVRSQSISSINKRKNSAAIPLAEPNISKSIRKKLLNSNHKEDYSETKTNNFSILNKFNISHTSQIYQKKPNIKYLNLEDNVPKAVAKYLNMVKSPKKTISLTKAIYKREIKERDINENLNVLKQMLRRQNQFKSSKSLKKHDQLDQTAIRQFNIEKHSRRLASRDVDTNQIKATMSRINCIIGENIRNAKFQRLYFPILKRFYNELSLCLVYNDYKLFRGFDYLRDCLDKIENEISLFLYRSKKIIREDFYLGRIVANDRNFDDFIIGDKYVLLPNGSIKSRSLLDIRIKDEMSKGI